MQQGGGGGGGGGGHQSQDEEMGAPTTGAVSSSHMVSEQSEQLVEAASPISSRPPATGNLDEFIRFASGGGDEGGDEGDRAGGGGGAAGVSSGNRWPRQETLALLKIRSDMDAVFRDATVKGPLWEDVSRKLAELGYKRSAKKCKEKFENVHKYYKRTKEGRAGRQDGKSYKFFSQLEALHTTSATVAANVPTPMILVTATTAASLDVAPVSVGIPMPISSVRIPPTTAIRTSSSVLPMPPAQVPPPITTTAAPFGISFSSNSSSSSEGFEDDDDGEDEVGGEPSSMAGTSRKRKRQSSRGGGSTTRRMMEFFEVLMKQVMQKQEAMQQRFLEAIERREQDRMIREEAWKRQEMARLTHEHELMAQERAIAASRDATIISFLEKITGQTIRLPTTVTIPAAPPPPTQPAVPVVPPIAPIPAATPPSHQPPSLPQQQQRNSQPQQLQQSQSHYQHQQQPQVVQQQQQQQQPQNTEVLRHHQQPISSEVLIAIPEQQVPPQEIGGSASLEPASSRWPKAEVLALINLRSGLETTYQEAGPKGPLWEEISTGMFRMGYRRSAKRCKEKWENINKYFKKVKESNKKRPEDAKTCPYFHQLDFLYREKILGGGTSGGSSSFGDRNRPEEETSQQHQETSDAPPIMAEPQLTQPTDQSEDKTGADVVTSKEHLPGSFFGEGNGGAAKKPEDIVRALMEERGMHQQQHHQGQSLLVDGYDRIDEPDSDNMDHDEDEDEDEDGDELEEERKIAYKIEFQRQNASTPNGGGNGAPSFLAMVQ